MHSFEIGAYGPREQALLERLASQIAPAVENAQLYDRTRQANAQATNTLAQLNAVVEGVDAVIFLVDQERRVIWANRRYAELFELDQEAATQETYREQASRREILRRNLADPDEVFARSDRMYANPDFSGPLGEMEVIHPQWRVLDGFTTPIYDDLGKNMGRLVVYNDITERKQAEQEVLDSNSQLGAVLDTAGEGIITIDSSGIIVMANQEVQEMWGYSQEELYGRPADLLMPSKYRDAHQAGLQRYLKTGESQVLGEWRELEGQRKDGSIFPLELNLKETRIGEELFFTAAVRDITKRKRAEESLRQAYAYLDSIMLNLPAGVAILDGPEFIYSKINHTLAEINGLSVEDHLGRPLAEVLPEASTFIVPRLREVLKTGKPAASHEFGAPMPGDPGNVRWFLDFFPVMRPDGEPQAVGTLVLDITERKRAEEALQGATARLQEQAQKLMLTNAELDKANQTKNQFLAHMSHELRTPLNASLGFARLLAEPSFGPLNEKQQRFVDHVVESNVHLLQLINDILDISRIESGRVEMDWATLDMREVLESCRRIAAGLATNKGLEFSVRNVAAGTLLYGDETKIKRIVLNLLGNAIKFPPEGGKVYLRASANQDRLTISVRDTGIGIHPQYHQEIFEMFEQGAPEISRQYQGSGLGLPLVKKLTELHGGEVSVKSVPGVGSTFSVALPLGSTSLAEPDTAIEVLPG